MDFSNFFTQPSVKYVSLVPTIPNRLFKCLDSNNIFEPKFLRHRLLFERSDLKLYVTGTYQSTCLILKWNVKFQV